MGAELDLNDVAAGNPLAEHELADLHAEIQRLRRALIEIEALSADIGRRPTAALATIHGRAVSALQQVADRG